MNPTALEIPRDQWPDFFDDLAREYDGWAITIEVVGRDIGDQPVTEGFALQAASYEREGSDAGDILFDTGDMGSLAVVHRVARPAHVFVTELQPGKETDLEITGPDGTTIVRMNRRPGLPPPS